ncbi:MAG: bifunctional folylpolyglutamate synthase/dihydrofolate synthase [Elusimicrobia bacterium]|nr:bifunctional folylpolyglutamate synthase/dihydrofolate synthase [Elusimicrobiota bacterium]
MKRILRYLQAKQESKILLGLDRVREFLEKIGNPQSGLRVIHAAGTNAKGSVCRMLANIFLEAGYKPGLYTSPHFYNVTERIEAGGSLISESDFSRIAHELMKVDGHDRLTYFEFLTVVAFVYFKDKRADPIILETGLGGRLDATNVVAKPLVSIITTIGFDHVNFLGSTIAAIATEKGGIIKPGVPVVLGDITPKALEVISKIAKKQGAPLIKINKASVKSKPLWMGRGKTIIGYQDKKYKLGILGAGQAKNAAVVLEALKILLNKKFKVTAAAIRKGLLKTSLPGRWDLCHFKGRPWVFDVAHNAQAVESFLDTLYLSPWVDVKPKRAILGFLKDKDYPAMLKLLAGHFDEFYLCGLNCGRSCRPHILAGLLKNMTKAEIKIFSSIKSAVRRSLKANSAEFTAVLGSFRLVAPAKKHLEFK